MDGKWYAVSRQQILIVICRTFVVASKSIQEMHHVLAIINGSDKDSGTFVGFTIVADSSWQFLS